MNLNKQERLLIPKWQQEMEMIHEIEIITMVVLHVLFQTSHLPSPVTHYTWHLTRENVPL